MHTLYLLAYGFNTFAGKVPALSGCQADAQRIGQFFSKYARANGYAMQAQVVTEPTAATRQQMIDSFQHFSAAGEGDICVFYYSGHGAQVPAPPELRHLEPDGMLETILCYDSRSDSQDLTDKEIRQLIYDVTTDESRTHKGCHFLALFDSCHSGSITRSSLLDLGPRAKMAPPGGAAYLLDSFHGISRFGRDEQKRLVPKVGQHITISACRAREVAYEKPHQGNWGGVFTQALLEVLEKEPLKNLTYAKLITLIRARAVVSPNLSQTPEADYQFLNNEGRLGQLPFLNNGAAQSLHHFIYYDQVKTSWMFNQGSLNYLASDTSLEVVDDAGQQQLVKIDELFPGYSTLNIGDWANPEQLYFVTNKLPIAKKIVIGIRKEAGKENNERVDHLVTALQNYQQQDVNNPLQFSEQGTLVDYWLAIEGDDIYVYPAGTIRPAFPEIPYNDSQWKEQLLAKLEHLAQWENTRSLSNPEAMLDLEKEFDIEFNLYPDYKNAETPGKPVAINISQGTPTISYQFRNNKWHIPMVSLALTRKKGDSYCTVPLYVTAIFLDELYGVSSSLLPRQESLATDTQAIRLSYTKEKGKTHYIFSLRQHDSINEWGEDKIRNTIKLIVSTHPFDHTAYDQPPLNVAIKEKEILKSKEVTRGELLHSKGFSGPEEEETEFCTWTVLDLPFYIERPLSSNMGLTGGKVTTGNIQVEVPAKFICSQVVVNSSASIAGAKTAVAFPALPDVTGVVEPFNLFPNAKSSQYYDVLELTGVENEEIINPQNPIILSAYSDEQNLDGVMPFAYDSTSGLFFPIGENEAGERIKITTLPTSREHGVKGLGKSVRIYLKRLVYTNLLGKADGSSILAYVQEIDGVFSYEQDKTKVKKAVATAENILILVHGLIGDSSDKREIGKRIYRIQEDGTKRYLSDIYDLILTYDYDSLGITIEEQAKKLKAALELAGVSKERGQHVCLVAHSLGGLVSRWMLEKEAGDTLISHFVQAGSPNAGSPLANMAYLLKLAITYGINFLPVPSFLNSIIKYVGKPLEGATKTLTQLKTNSELVTQLGEVNDAAIPYTIITGDVITDHDAQLQHKGLMSLIRKISLGNIKENVLEKFFAGSNDAVVAVKSMKTVPDSENVRFASTIACNHFEYFNTTQSLEVLKEVLWLNNEGE